MQSVYEEFTKAATALSAEVHMAANKAEAKTILANILEQETGTKIGMVTSQFLNEIVVDSVVGGKEVFMEAELRKRPEDMDIGISEVEIGIAETGTIGQDAESVDKRLVSTLPELHIAFLKKSMIVRTVVEAMEIIEGWVKSKDPTYIALISGPSRTADIERILTIGVHGPGRLAIIVVDEQGGDE